MLHYARLVDRCSRTWQTRHRLNFLLPTPLLYDRNEARGLVMDADGPAQLTSKDPTGFTSPETWNSETAERLCSEPLKSPQKQRMQETYPAEDNTPRRRSARLAQTSTPVRPLNLRIIVPQVEEVIEETDLSNDGAEINQDVEDGEFQQSIFFQSDQYLLQSLHRCWRRESSVRSATLPHHPISFRFRTFV